MKYPTQIAPSRSHLRQLIRQRRNQLSPLEQKQAGLQLLEQIKNLPQINHAQNIAIYLSADGEVDTQPTIEWLWKQGKKVCLPVIHPFSKGHLLFIDYQLHSELYNNRYGIAEPKLNKNKICLTKDIDIIFTPLVAFDSSGQRLGMGGGYYDRTLEKWFHTKTGALPIGLAHDCQRVEHIPSEHWDIPLPIFVTPSKIWHWENSN